MRSLVLSILLGCTVLAQPLSAQWRKIYHLDYSQIENIYFIDLPGPPRLGFMATADLWRTTDGGKSWGSEPCWINPGIEGWVTYVNFKDSLTGWFCFAGYPHNYIYRTTDGGRSWSQLPWSINAYGVDYSSATGRLFASCDVDGFYVSTDLGDSWSPVLPFIVHDFSVFSPLVSLATVAFSRSDTIGGYCFTSDGGISWDTLRFHDTMRWIRGFGALAISGSSTCFAVSYVRILISRSDDYGHTWRQVKDYGPPTDSNDHALTPHSYGVIRGDLSHLWIKTDSGMFLSTDEGLNWKNVGGPPEIDNFYAAHGVTYVTTIVPGQIHTSGDIWEYDWDQADAEQPPTTPLLEVYPNPARDRITINLETPANYEVLDVLGDVRLRGKSEEPTLTLDVSQLASGTYLVRVANGWMGKTVKFIKE
jgi:hypothetical protein